MTDQPENQEHKSFTRTHRPGAVTDMNSMMDSTRHDKLEDIESSISILANTVDTAMDDFKDDLRAEIKNIKKDVSEVKNRMFTTVKLAWCVMTFLVVLTWGNEISQALTNTFNKLTQVYLTSLVNISAFHSLSQALGTIVAMSLAVATMALAAILVLFVLSRFNRTK